MEKELQEKEFKGEYEEFRKSREYYKLFDISNMIGGKYERDSVEKTKGLYTSVKKPIVFRKMQEVKEFIYKKTGIKFKYNAAKEYQEKFEKFQEARKENDYREIFKIKKELLNFFKDNEKYLLEDYKEYVKDFDRVPASEK